MKRCVLLLFCCSLFMLTACDEWDEDGDDFDDETAVSLSQDPADDEWDEDWDDEWDEDNGATAVSPNQAPPAASANDSSSRFQDADCPFPVPGGYTIDCGYLIVPENRSRNDSRSIQLAVAIVRAPRAGQQPPVLYLAGGPGSSALDEFLGDPEGWNYPFLQTRDLILLDQRGTGYSFPTLDCPELADADFTAGNPEQECHSRLRAEGIDLTAYNSAENGADVADLRRALAYDEWDLLGISYGTRLALVVMRDQPQGIRSVVLDSPFPPNANTPVDEALNTWESLQTLFADCQADAYCRQNYPNLERVFLDTVADLNDQPAGDLFGDDFFFAITQALNDTGSIPLLPWVIYAVSDGNYDALDEIASGEGFGRRYQDEPDRSDSEGMYNSVICRDEYAFGNYEAAEAALTAVAPPEIEAALLQGVSELFQTCAYWGAGRAAPIEDAAVHSDIPTLILVGQYDHATPPKWGYLTAETLSRAYLYDFPGGGHSLISSGDCAVDLITQFYDNPLAAPNVRCVDEIEWPYFE
jgi:pimeloyl-ACP methyl ester carboxylesterase